MSEPFRILCNYPVEAFQPRADYRDTEVITYGPPDKKVVEGRHFPLDIPFDPARGSIEELFASLPKGWVPDLMLIYYPGQEPLPRGLERCPTIVCGVVSDWNLHFEQLWGLEPFFDLILTDRLGTGIFREAGYSETAYWPQYPFRTGLHEPRPEIMRDIDIAFAGNMNPEVQGERMKWLDRVKNLGGNYRVFVGGGVRGNDYGMLLSRCRIGFNRSIRREMNLRAFEVCAAEALLFMEHDNLEVREYLEPDRDVVLYDDSNLESRLIYFLEHEDERARIAVSGREKILQYSFARNLERLRPIIAAIRPGIRVKVPQWKLHLARANALSRTWADPAVGLAEAVAALRLQPGNAEVHNSVAVLLALHDSSNNTAMVASEIELALNLDPGYLPAMMNMAFFLAHTSQPDAARRVWEKVIQISKSDLSFAQLRGLVLPCQFSARENELRVASANAVLENDPQLLSAAYAHLAGLLLAENRPAPTPSEPALT